MAYNIDDTVYSYSWASISRCLEQSISSLIRHYPTINDNRHDEAVITSLALPCTESVVGRGRCVLAHDLWYNSDWTSRPYRLARLDRWPRTHNCWREK